MRGRVIVRSAALIGCAALLLVWGWSFRVERGVGWALPSGRVTLRLADGRLTLWGPPAGTGSAAEQLAAGDAARLRNSQIVWPNVVLDEQNQLSLASQASAVQDTPPAELLDIADVRQTGGPLLKALEDPDRIAAAHFVLVGTLSQTVLYGRLPNGALYLTRRIRPAPLMTRTQRLLSDPSVRLDAPDHVMPHSILIDCNGLRMELWPEGASLNRSAYPVRVEGGPDAFRPDASTFDAVRDFWHRQLDRRIVGAPAWVMPSIIAVYPLIVAASVVMKHRARLRAGCCHRCGYNLTGNTSGVCPECGTPVTEKPDGYGLRHDHA